MLAYELTIEDLQAPYLALEARLKAAVTDNLRDRILVTRQLAIHGYFVYEFHAVSMFWAASCIEMALKLKFNQLHPEPITVTKKANNGSEQTGQIRLVDLPSESRQKWRVPDALEIAARDAVEIEKHMKAVLREVLVDCERPRNMVRR